MKIKIFAGSILALALFLLLREYGPWKGRTLRDLEPVIGISLPVAREFRVERNLLRKGREGAFRSIEAAREGELLKIELTEGLSEQQASQAVIERLTMIQSLYRNLPSPYPGMVTNKITVADTLEPQVRNFEIEGETFPLYILAGNARFTYGAMTAETVAYLSGLCFFYKRSTATLYRFDFFVPKEKFNQAALVSFFAGIRPTGGKLIFPDRGTGAGKPGAASPSGETEKLVPPGDGPLQYKDCNLILIALEPLGANHVSSYGYGKKTTPNLDAFAANGFLFENAVSSSSWSLPAFMSWFTSLYPSRHKVVNKYSTFTEQAKVLANLSELSPGTTTMARIFRQNGYRTAGFTGDASLSRDYGFGLGFEEYYDGKRFGGFDLTMPKAVAWLSEHKNEKMFLFVQGYDVHGRFPLDQQYVKDFLGEQYAGPFKGTEEEYWKLRNLNIENGEISVTEEDMRLWRAVYDAKIFAADKRFGVFIERLREMGLLEKSIIIFSSGSGNEYNEHGRIDHGFSLYEELVHVPLIIMIPGRHGDRVHDLVRTVDILPTVIDLLDLSVSPQAKKQLQGVSLVPLLAGEHLNLSGISETDYLQRAFKRSIKTNDGWKLIVSLDSEKRELYNLNDDPGERNNLIESEGRKAYELEQLLFSHLRDHR